MSSEMYQLIAIVLYMAAMVFIGWYAFKRTSSLTDYMLGGRSLGPMVTALSAGAADMSGWLLMGLPGAIYLNGLVEAWIAIGLTIGAYLNWLLVAPRLRVYTQVSNDSITIPSYLESRLKDTSRLLTDCFRNYHSYLLYILRFFRNGCGRKVLLEFIRT